MATTQGVTDEYLLEGLRPDLYVQVIPLWHRPTGQSDLCAGPVYPHLGGAVVEGA